MNFIKYVKYALLTIATILVTAISVLLAAVIIEMITWNEAGKWIIAFFELAGISLLLSIIWIAISNPSLSAIDIMKITIITIGKKNEAWVQPGVSRFLERLRAPFAAEMIILPHSSFEGDRARQEESERIFSRLNSDDFVILLDERGKNLSSPELSNLITEHTNKHIVFIIGGAYGVTSDLRQKSNVVWSLSNLVFPHQLVRLILAEQLYRAQEIHRGSHYHHS